MAIPLIDVKAQYEPLLPELKERISAVLEDGRFILGPNVQAFEQEAADYLGVEHGVVRNRLSRIRTRLRTVVKEST